MIEIGDHILAAFEAEAGVDRVRDFALWWSANQAQLGPAPSQDVLRVMLDRGDELARSLELDQDDEPQRFYLCAVFKGWMPEPNARQYLLGTDVIFDDHPAPESIATLAQLARGTQ